jgi:hypothetical protein
MGKPRDQARRRSADRLHGWAPPVAAGLLAAALLGLTPASGAADTAGHWTRTGDLNNARAGHTATRLLDGRVLVVGGDGLASAEIYDPRTGSWAGTGSMSQARSNHTATLLPDGRVLVAGGWSEFHDALASAEIYDPSTGSWAITGAMHDARSEHTSTLLPDTIRLPDGLVLVAGGTHAPPEFTLDTAEIYDPARGTWTTTGRMNVGRFLHAATALRDGRVLVTGGIERDSYLDSAELFDPRAGTWTTTGSMQQARRWHTATLLPDGRVLVAGGSRGADDLVLRAELYQPPTGTWTSAGDLDVGRQLHTATLLANGAVLVTGGYGPATQFERLASAEIYAAGGMGVELWVRTDDMLEGRGDHTATLLADGRVLVAGGNGVHYENLASAELYTP